MWGRFRRRIRLRSSASVRAMSVHSATGCCGEMVEQVGDATIRWVARKEVGATELTVGVTRMKAGGMNPAHRHPNCEEVLHVLEGEVEHYCEGEPLVRLHAGHTAIVPRNRRHRARNVGATEAQWVVSFSSAERQTIFVRDEPDAHLQELSKLFNVPRVDKISWGHAVNSQALTAECIANGTQFFEADIIARASDSVPVMGHPPATDSDITFDEWAHKVAAARRGLKLDMKHASVLSPVMATLTRMVHEKKLPPEVPVWLNADVVEIASAPHITAADLVAAATAFQKIHPNMALSTGFTLSRTSVYTHAKREELEHAVASFPGHVTVPLHAGLVCRDWTAVRPFLDRTNFSITLWGQITKEQLEFLEKNVIGPKVFPDVQLQH